MSMPGMYVSPEQLMQDRADYARKGIARGRSLVTLEYGGGIALVAENASATLRKVSEIYDRIAFGGVGRYIEFDQLRIAGVRHAELKGYQYSRSDVEARSLANQYAQMLGQFFTHELKPLEVEIVVVEVGLGDEANQLYRIQYDGTVMDEEAYCCIGGEADAVRERVADGYDPELDADAAIRLACAALAGPEREIAAPDLEVALLESNAGETTHRRRCFRRLDDAEVELALGDGAAPEADEGADQDDS
ncbi:proteasome subunit alpha [Candidatus Poriferisodalis sp.]|uniref:proteasome subunit alpha n=1 Tax=Candidatus Poriferisodalis sp. TaxID=3101277 RepID=UPI003B026890